MFRSATCGSERRAIKSDLGEKIEEHGFTIVDTLINDIRPDKKVQDSMNEINISQRLLEATKNCAEAEMITIITKAQGDKDKMKLIGKGVAAQRTAILEGHRSGLSEFASLRIDPREAMKLIILSQQIDAWKDLANSHNAKVIFSTTSFTNDSNNNVKTSDEILEALSAIATSPSIFSQAKKYDQSTIINDQINHDYKKAF